ncbi:RNA polymerase sigma factor (sigma-70 family) [Methylobacterium sp. BE186]|uniref:sigma-70 family RNA polymerase sigma factor n=1 Tax=Methylobacterium sp. BE186 TaxID=2817715 RepID=UPI0028602680|nr:sigma-70 family RNA polymerase sigma factor [Methylobacterium sp. BE186]MDR7037652.1 RNA polymerase sigma factor (sigma-70 family) [Methylobacterium sp. BE186]
MLIAGGLGLDHPEVAEAPAPPLLPAAVLDHLGAQLQAAYGALASARPPQHLLDLIAKLDGVLATRSGHAEAVREGLIEALPGLRTFALSLVADATRADDLVQETVLRAWAAQDRFVPGTNLKAWLCTILRNQFYTECRKRKREVEDADGAMAAQLTAPAAQEHGSDLRTIWGQIAKLPPPQREALLLVGAQGLTYEAAAEVMGCQTGTVKSRVSRARSFLAASLGTSLLESQAG